MSFTKEHPVIQQIDKEIHETVKTLEKYYRARSLSCENKALFECFTLEIEKLIQWKERLVKTWSIMVYGKTAD